MPRPDIRLYKPSSRSIWRCPCGYEAPYHNIIGHRKGYRNRPECSVGRIRRIEDAPRDPITGQWNGEEHGEGPQAKASKGSSDIFPQQENDEAATMAAVASAEPINEAEEIARLINAQQLAAAGMAARGNGAGSELQTPPPEGEYRVEQPPQFPLYSSDKVWVIIPLKARVVYDWARQEGWDQGDGSFSAFVWDCLDDHFRRCWGIELFVGWKKELGVE